MKWCCPLRVCLLSLIALKKISFSSTSASTEFKAAPRIFVLVVHWIHMNLICNLTQLPADRPAELILTLSTVNILSHFVSHLSA